MPVITNDGHFDPTGFKTDVQALVELGQVKADAMPPDAAFHTEQFLE
jgi:hypothetical protein